MTPDPAAVAAMRVMACPWLWPGMAGEVPVAGVQSFDNRSGRGTALTAPGLADPYEGGVDDG